MLANNYATQNIKLGISKCHCGIQIKLSCMCTYVFVKSPLVIIFLLQVKNIATEAHKENTASVITANANMDMGPQAKDTATEYVEKRRNYLEPVCCKTWQKKVQTKKLVWGIEDLQSL